MATAELTLCWQCCWTASPSPRTDPLLMLHRCSGCTYSKEQGLSGNLASPSSPPILLGRVETYKAAGALKQRLCLVLQSAKPTSLEQGI